MLLALAVVTYLARLASGRTRLERLPLDGPLLAFSVWTLLSAAFSPDPVASYESSKKLVLFALLPLAVDSLAEERDRERILDAALLGGIVLGAGTLLQYFFLGYDTVELRPHSFLGHYMTASGLSMSVTILAAARLAFRRGPWGLPSRGDIVRLGALVLTLGVLTALQAIDLFAVEAERLFVAGVAAAAAHLALSREAWPGPATGTWLALLVIPVSACGLVLAQTRNTWLGVVVGLALVAILRAPRMLWLLAGALALLLVLQPAPLVRRLTVTDASSLDRYYMWQAGIDMIADKPVFGQGPGMILDVYPTYRWPGAPSPRVPHLHDNALQIAAERGLPCLAWWLWLVSAAMADAYRESRRGPFGAGWVAPGALGILTALMVGGLFEYNFGDSEILMFMLLIAALPYALRRQRAAFA